MNSDDLKARLAQQPDLVPYLKRIVRHAATAERLPPRIVLGADVGSSDLFERLNRLLSGRCRIEKGKYILRLAEPLRAAGLWQPFVEAIGYMPRPDNAAQAAALARDAAKRLRLLHPGERALVDALEESGVLRAFIGTDRDREDDALKLFDACLRLRDAPGITLSQLGSDCFNDSKALRGGALRGQLERMLQVVFDQPDLSSAELLAHCGVIDNPYTSHAIVFAPFTFHMGAAGAFDFPRALFAAGQAAVLPWETIQRIGRITLDAPLRLVTSENAAPFLDWVRAGVPAVYTEGYPNGAVRGLLRHFAAAGATAEHAGDSDLDGYRIAEQIGRSIPVTGLLPRGGVAHLPHKPLDEAQRARIENYIARHPGFPYLEELRHTLAHGWVEQETAGGAGG